jgi:hypothetical protein
MMVDTAWLIAGLRKRAGSIPALTTIYAVKILREYKMWQLLLRLFGGGKTKQQEPVDTRTLGELGIVEPTKPRQELSPRAMSRQVVRPPKKFDPTTTERAIKRFDAINRSRPDSPRLSPYPMNTGNANRHAVIDDSIYYAPSRPITGYNADTEPQRYSCVNPSPAPAVPYNPPCPTPSYNNPSPSYYSDPSPSWDSGGSSCSSDGGGCD